MAEIPSELLADPSVPHRAIRAAVAMWAVVRRDSPDPTWWGTHDDLGSRMGATRVVAEKATRDLCRAGWAEREQDAATGKWVTRLRRTAAAAVRVEQICASPAALPPAVVEEHPDDMEGRPYRSGTPGPYHSVRTHPAETVDPPLPQRPSTSPKPSPKPSPNPPRPMGPASSGVFAELDQRRRALGAELGRQLPGWYGQDAQVPFGIGRALDEHDGDVDAVWAVVENFGRKVHATGDPDLQRRFRRLWHGDGWGFAVAQMPSASVHRGVDMTLDDLRHELGRAG